MSNLSEQEIAEYLEKAFSRSRNSSDKDIVVLLNEWENLISELSNKEVMLYHRKEAYQVRSDEIIAETNFKALFGKNNADVRKQYVKEQLRTEHETIKALEFSVDWIGRRISFLRELVKTKRALMEVKR